MTYTPKSEEQLAKEGLLPEGTYDFEVIETSDRPSKKGNDMFMLKFRVFGHDGESRIVWDYIVLGTNFGERKLRNAAAACGLLEIYATGELTDRTFMGATGKALIRQQDGTPDFPMPKNVVGEYIASDDDSRPTPKIPTKDLINDDIPF
jgi:hypothetical protein